MPLFPYSLQLTRNLLIQRWLKSILITLGIILLTATLCPRLFQAEASWQSESTENLLALQNTSTPGGLQRGTPQTLSRSDSKGQQCQSQLANWDRNRPTWSWFWGVVFYVVFIYLLTFLSIKSTYLRAFLSTVLACLFGTVLLALQIHESLQVCPQPPGFWAAFSVPILIWTILGIASVMVLFAIIRQVFVVNREFRKKPVTS